jgi:hypothetical protein
VGDFDGDGRLDLIAANWGLNTKYSASPTHPRRLYRGDFDGDGAWDLIESYKDSMTGKEVPERDLTSLRRAIPLLAARYSTHREFGAATVEEILGDALPSAAVVSVNTLASLVLLNRSGHFEVRPLPAEAQLAPAFGVVVADFDGDGWSDVFLGQNFFAYQPQTTRSDAGRGLWLKGDGRGGFRAVPAAESGIAVYGESRGAAAADFDGDGRVDLVVTQNGAAAKLFRNVRARPGLRVRLAGPPGNPEGVGAVVRARGAQGIGPAQPVLAGSGYWSQNAAVQVLSVPESPGNLEVRWPGGNTTTHEVADHVRELSVTADGGTRAIRRE